MKRNSGARLLCLAAMIAAALATIPARAGGVAPGEEPPGKLRILTFFDNPSTTSKCIGRPVTPLCAAETVEVCVMRKEPALCKTADYLTPGWWPTGLPLADHLRQDSVQYKVIEIKTMTDAGIPPHRRTQGANSWRAGDVQVILYRQYCSPAAPPPDHCAGWEESPIIYTTRRVGNRWRVIHRFSPRTQ